MNKLIYLLVFLFSGLFYFIYKTDQPKNEAAEAFQFYTSVKCPQLKVLSFYSNETPLVHWKGPFEAYTQVDFFEVKRSMDEKSFRLRIEHKGKNDTLNFLALNFLIDENVLTLQPEQFQSLKTSTNCKILQDKNQLKLVCLNEEDAWLDLNSPMIWKTDSNATFKKTYVIILSLLIFLTTLYFKPESRRFFAVFLITLFMSLYLWRLGKEPCAQINIKSLSPKNELTVYFNSIPEFEKHLSFNYIDTTALAKIQAFPNKYPFYRINFHQKVHSLQHTDISYEMGLFHKTWKIDEIKPFQINGNGLNYKDSILFTSGSDTYLCMTSAEFSKNIKRIDFLRSNVFMPLATLIFIFLMYMSSRLSTEFKSRHILSYTFLLICFCSPLILLFDARRLIMNDEKRLALELPKYTDTLELREYTKQLDNYLKDQIPGRNQLIFLNNYIKYGVFSELATNPMVYFGKNKWMFYIGENVKEIYENKILYTPKELKKMTHTLEERRDWLKEQGIDYYIVFPPMSHYFYQEYIGKGIYHFNTITRLEQFLKYLQNNSDLKVVDVYTPMMAAKKKFKRELYFKTDTHWNLFGAYFAYAAIIDHIKKDHPGIKAPIPFKNIKWLENKSYEADLAKLISLDALIPRQYYDPKHKDISSSIAQTAPLYPELGPIHSTLLYKGGDTLAPRLLMYRDSYSNYLIPYFSKHFSRQTYLWTPLFFPTIVEKEKPDIIICEMMERFLNDLLIDNPPLPLKEPKDAPIN